MPSKYVVREFAENEYYHVFNRGIEKRKIFLDEQDYNVFLYYLFVYTALQEDVFRKYPALPLRLQGKNLSEEIEIIAFCLMPNHFHFLIKQNSKDGISKLLKQLLNAYTLYFNNKYKRVGPLMQGRFKAAIVKDDNLLIHLTRYIHLNPVASSLVNNPKEYKWSSFQNYLGAYSEIKCMREVVLSSFPSVKEYERFVLDQVDYLKELNKIKDVSIDEH